MTERKGKRFVPPGTFVVHPDQLEWLKNYKGESTPIDPVFAERQRKLEEGGVFWDDTHDAEMQETVIERNKTIGRALLGWLRGGK
jgi:hypothetical protein